MGKTIALAILLPFITIVSALAQNYSDNRPGTSLRMDAADSGIVLRHGDGPGNCDLLGARDVWVFEDGGTYYMHYDGAGKKGWLCCLAVSKDLVNWEKKGPILDFGNPSEDDSKSASYGVTYKEGNEWHLFYLGTPNTSSPPDLIPSFPYLTMKAKGAGPAGPWIKQKQVVPFRTKPDTYYSITASPGHVIKNDGEYLQFFSSTTLKTGNPCVQRTLSIARTKDLDGAWTIDPKPIVPIEEQVENSSLYYEKSNKTWFLFTNHIGIDGGEYTDAIWVYWSRDLNKWDPENKAIVMDGKNCSWSAKCIGLPSVLPVGNRLALLYDAPGGNSTSHMNRNIGLAWLDLPLTPPEQKEVAAFQTLSNNLIDNNIANKPFPSPADPEYYAMDRHQMHFDDYQVMLINYRGFVCPRQYSMTSFTSVQFLPASAPSYAFNLNFLDPNTGKTVRDDVPAIWDKWINEGKEEDPLAANFRPNASYMMVTQDETWQPNACFRSGTFHKEIEGKWLSFSIKSCTSVSYGNDEVFLKITLRNRKPNPLKLILIPQQIASQMFYDGMKGSGSAGQIDAFTLGSEQLHARVSSDIETINDKGFELTLPADEYVTVYFAVQFYQADKPAPAIFQKDIKLRMEQAGQVTREKLKWAFDNLPRLESSNPKLQEYYYRCMLSVLMSRYENPNYITNPFWAVGYWPYTISWDTSYSSDILAMLDPKSLKEAILTDFREVRMKKTYVSWKGAFWDNIYIQEPFALQIMIEAYLRHTGDYSLFSEKAGDASVWEWMQRWINELKSNYTNKLGLIDVGYDTQKIIEIRTDGYNHAVPIVNVLTVHLLYRMSEWAGLLNDNSGKGYYQDAERLKGLMNKYLWNDQLGWFENLYPDGTKSAIWTNHLFDALGTDYLSGTQVNKLVSHLREGVFLGKFGVYSIARKDSVHWDLIDSDWGGGGQYAGMPGRISRNLYKQGFPELGWEILKRNMRYIDYFPYLPQNPRTDSPLQDRSSMPVEISAGAGMEAIIFGTFGINIDKNVLTIRPNTHEDLGVTTLSGLKFRGKSYAIEINKRNFSVFRDGKLIAVKPYGESIVIN